MSGQTLIRLTNVTVTSQQDIELLITAAEDIQSATEANFRHIKEKKWYKRLWEIATFSKDNIKAVAKNTASLAQMQDIVLRVILMASKESKELSMYLATHSEQLESLAKGQVKLAQAIAKIKYGHDPRPDLHGIQAEYQYVIVSTALKFVDQACGEQDTNHLVQQYLQSLHNCCRSGLNPEVFSFDYAKINYLKSDEHRLLAHILCELDILLDDTVNKKAAFNEVARYISVSAIMFEEIKSKAAIYARILGKEFIAAYYAVNDADLFLIAIDETDTDAVKPEVVKKHRVNQIKLLIIVYNAETKQCAEYLHGQIVGLASKGAPVNAIAVDEKSFSKYPPASKASSQGILFIGDFKESREVKKNITKWQFNNFGICYGWHDDKAVILFDRKKLSEEEYFKMMEYAKSGFGKCDMNSLMNEAGIGNGLSTGEKVGMGALIAGMLFAALLGGCSNESDPY